MTKKLNNKLIEFIQLTEKNKSSHWKEITTQNLNINDPNALLGLGIYSEKNFLNGIFHQVFSNLVFGKKIKQLETYKFYEKLFSKSNRIIDTDAIRHIHTFEYLKKIKNVNKICIIGDGKLNGVIGSIAVFPNAKIFLVNIAETFINDLNVNKKMSLIDEEEIKLVETIENLSENKLKTLNLIPAHLKDFLKNYKIDLFINISSFQEMNLMEINEYFNIIKSLKSLLYSCNRISKKLPDGSIINSKDYPWESGKIILDEICPWHRYYYNYSFPFIHKYDGLHVHKLIDYS